MSPSSRQADGSATSSARDTTSSPRSPSPLAARALLGSWAVAAPQRCTLDVFLLLTRGDQVLLALRQGTGFADGMWNLPSGKAENSETAVAAVIREAREELGIHLTEHEISYTATVHCRNSDTDTRIGLFFHATAKNTPRDAPYNAEPHKCAKLAWYPMALLPDTTMPYSALGVSLHQNRAQFGTIGW
jgi:8-oxo-dGTP diphosphatase